MAITSQNIYLDHPVANNFAPSGHGVDLTPGSIGTVDNTVFGVDFEVLATASAGANKVTAFDDLLNTELVAVIDAYLAANAPGQGLDLTANDVQYNARVRSITRGSLANDILLSDANVNFVIKVDLEYSLS